jgi:hypothetical protein
MQGHLIHIGFAKAGSTALQAWFDVHPKLVHVTNGLAGHSGGEHLARHAATEEDLHRWYVTSSEHLSVPRRAYDRMDGPADGPIADRRARACKLLYALFGDATILIVTRGFRAILASAYSQYVRTGGTLAPPELVRLLPDPESGVDAADDLDYDATIALYRETFGAEHVLVLPYELLRDDPLAFVATLEDRLGIERSGIAPPRVNTALSEAELYWYPRLTRVAQRATTPFGARGAHAFDFYRARIGRHRLGRGVALLARMSPDAVVNPAHHVPAELVERCRGRASSVATLPAYAPYAAEYLNDRR